MVSKKQVLQLIDMYGLLFIKLLKLEHYIITWHVIHSKSKYEEVTKEAGFDANGCVAQCIFHPKKNKICKSFKIIIFYDKQKGKKFTIGSIIHELLHIKLRQFDLLIHPKKEPKFDKLEEDLVSDLEKIFIALL